MIEERAAFILENGVDCTVNGTTTKATIGRIGKKTDAFSWENERQGGFLPDTDVPGGALVENTLLSESYLVRSIYPEAVDGAVVAKVAQMLKINATVNVLRYSDTYDDYGNPIPGTGAWKDTTTGDTLTPIKTFAEFISANMRQSDPGLLASTVIRLYIQSAVPVQLLDRVGLGENYQVDAINLISSPGLAIVQLSKDTRG